MERFLKKCGITHGAYREWSGSQPLNHFGRDNPTWSQRAWEIVVLENLEVMGAAILQTLDERGLRKPSTDGNGHGRA
jgi:hypothetical protein